MLRIDDHGMPLCDGITRRELAARRRALGMLGLNLRRCSRRGHKRQRRPEVDDGPGEIVHRHVLSRRAAAATRRGIPSPTRPPRCAAICGPFNPTCRAFSSAKLMPRTAGQLGQDRRLAGDVDERQLAFVERLLMTTGYPQSAPSRRETPGRASRTIGHAWGRSSSASSLIAAGCRRRSPCRSNRRTTTT